MYEPNHITEAQVNHLCLCTGYDGVGRGLREVFPNLRTVAYVEIEAFAVANLVAKSEAEQMDAAPIFTNVKTFPYRKFRGCVDILSAGFPCQPFSAAGKRKATEDPRHLYPSIANGITLCKPRYVLLENVEGIVSAKTADGESVLLYVLRDLESRGYECAWGTFSAAEVGAPHLRKRIFILSKLGNPKHDGSSTSEDWGSTCAEQEEGRMQELEGGREQSQDELAYSKHKRVEWTEKGARLRKKGKKEIVYGAKLRDAVENHENSEEAKKNNGPRALEKSNTSGKNQGSPKLNPTWVEQMMGLPIGLTQLPTEWID
jgi:site-specific DNA-cytosine methylase